MKKSVLKRELFIDENAHLMLIELMNHREPVPIRRSNIIMSSRADLEESEINSIKSRLKKLGEIPLKDALSGNRDLIEEYDGLTNDLLYEEDKKISTNLLNTYYGRRIEKLEFIARHVFYEDVEYYEGIRISRNEDATSFLTPIMKMYWIAFRRIHNVDLEREQIFNKLFSHIK